ncbi:MAG: MBL fold metallo-hydrolase [Candidatus Campbellbacteria bacterium]|nr:MBL fold metallo-hydrolase [Candidatus Campbellbacteria bacterium]
MKTSQYILCSQIFAIASLLAIAYFVYYISENDRQVEQQELKLSFLDVGQGDSIFIETPTGFQILVDGGNSGTVLTEIKDVLELNDREIDMLIATHPDADHIGGLVDVLKRFSVRYFVHNGVESGTATYRALTEEMEDEGAEIIVIDSPQVFAFSDGVTLEFISPQKNLLRGDRNDTSIVARLLYGETTALLTGDISTKIERSIANNFGKKIESDILKVSHHGSRHSSDALFLSIVNPDFSIISAEENSRYGHPHKDVVDRINQNTDSILLHTKDKKTHFVSDGFAWYNKE